MDVRPSTFSKSAARLLPLVVLLCMASLLVAEASFMSKTALLRSRLRSKNEARMPGPPGIQVRFVGQTHIRSIQDTERTFEHLLGDLHTTVGAVTGHFPTSDNEPGVLNVFLGGEWRFRRTKHGLQLTEQNFADFIEQLKGLSTTHPNWVLAPGTFFFELDRINTQDTGIFSSIWRMLGQQETPKQLVVNCLAVAFQGDAHVICKKDECDFIDYDVQHWAFEELVGRDKFGTKPWFSINFEGHQINIGVDICLDSSNGRLRKALEETGYLNNMDIYLVSGDGGSLSTEEQVLAPGGFSFMVNVMANSVKMPSNRLALHAIKQKDRTVAVFLRPPPTVLEIGPDPVNMPIMHYELKPLPFN